MHAGQVVALEIIVDISFPVAFHVVSSTLEELHALKVELFSLLWQRFEALSQRTRVGVQGHENEVEPFFGAHRHESKVLGAKSLDSFDFGCADQRAVKTVGPAVIAAPEKLAGAAAFGGRAGTVPAYVVEPAQLAIRAADN